MTPDERNMLTELANKIAQTPAPPRDPEAEELIRSQIGKRPDALYLMTQTVLIQNMALQQAQKQIQDLQQNRGSGSSGSGSFLGQSSAGPSWQQQQPQYAQPAQQYAAPPPAAAPSGAPSFLRGAAQTAAGVAAGALAFEGIQSLFSHPGYGGGSGFGGFGGGGFGERPVEETVVNNYYDSPAGGSGGGNDLSLGDNRDRNSFADTGSSDYDDSNTDDSSELASSDDSGSFDDSGSDFS